MKIKNKKLITPIILVRIDSKRLFGKCFLPIYNKKNILECILLQLKFIKGLSKPILAIPRDKINNPLKKFAIKNKITFFAGSKNNVAKRMLDAANSVKTDYVLRVNGDSPFLDKDLINKAINNKFFFRYNYHTNILNRTYPYGISLQIIRVKFLSKLLKKNIKKKDLEDITPILHKTKYAKGYKSYKLNKLFNWKRGVTLDTSKDYLDLKKLLKKVKLLDKNFTWYKSKIMQKHLLNE